MSTTSPEQAQPPTSPPSAADGSTPASAPVPPPPAPDAPAPAATEPPRPGSAPFWRRRWVLWGGAGLLALLLAGGGFAAGFAIGAGTAASAASGFPGHGGDGFGPRGDRMPPGTDDGTGTESVPNS
jgi:hypothetical protein